MNIKEIIYATALEAIRGEVESGIHWQAGNDETDVRQVFMELAAIEGIANLAKLIDTIVTDNESVNRNCTDGTFELKKEVTNE